MLSEATGCSLGKLLLSSWLLTSSITLWGTVRGVCIRLIQYSGNHPPHTFASKYYAKRGLIFRSLLDYNILFQITEVLPKTFSGKKVREPLKGLAQNLSMHGKLWQEICTTDIKKYCCPDLLRVHLVWCSLMHEFIFYEFVTELVVGYFLLYHDVLVLLVHCLPHANHLKQQIRIKHRGFWIYCSDCHCALGVVYRVPL